MKRPQCRWTPERLAFLARTWPDDAEASDILATLNKMEGGPMTMNALYKKVEALKLKRGPAKARGPHGDALDSERFAEFERRYKARESTLDMAAHFGVHRTTVRGWIRKLGWDPLHPHKPRMRLPLKRIPWTDDDTKELKVLKAKGLSRREIARRMNRPVATIHEHIAKALPLKPKPVKVASTEPVLAPAFVINQWAIQHGVGTATHGFNIDEVNELRQHLGEAPFVIRKAAPVNHMAPRLGRTS